MYTFIYIKKHTFNIIIMHLKFSNKTTSGATSASNSSASCGLLCTAQPPTTTTILWPFFRDYPGELVSEENFWTL